MLLNPNLKYVQGYTNIYYGKNQKNNNNEDNKIQDFVILSYQINNNMNSNTEKLINDKNKFVEMNKMIPSIYSQNVVMNINPGGAGPFPNNVSNNNSNNNNFNNNSNNDNNFNNNNNLNNNFFIYGEDENEINNDGIWYSRPI